MYEPLQSGLKDVEWNHDTQTGLWLNKGHKPRMEAIRECLGQEPSPATLAAMYLLTADKDIARRTAECFCRKKIDFTFANTRGISPHAYTLFSAARDIYADKDGITLSDLSCDEIIDPIAFRLIVNALHIARSGTGGGV
jgi:hypothetical protein